MPAVVPNALAAASGRDWVTRKEAAVLARCSEDTIKRLVRDKGLATAIGDSGAVLVRFEDLVRLGKVASENLTAADTTSAQTVAELRRGEADLAAAREQLAELTGRLAERTALVDQLKAQVKAKDNQLDALLRNLTNLTATTATMAAAARGGAA